jgi:DNA-binding HxlR family transcriptional regulator
MRAAGSIRPTAGDFHFDSHLLCFGQLPDVPQMTSRPNRLCPISRTLDIIGDRWSILILRDLVLDGPRKFGDLQQGLRGISPNTLSARLKTLEDHGIVERRFYDQHPPRAEYVLTARGRELRPVLKVLKDWGERYTRP